jgi:hypothetical protein
LQIIVTAGDCRGWREHTAFRQAGNLVVEVARHHIADFAEVVRHLGTDFIQVYAEGKAPVAKRRRCPQSGNHGSGF